MINLDFIPIPHWFDDRKAVAPCPCGRPIDEDVLRIEGSTGLSRWFHPECMNWLRKEMDEDERKEMDEWKDWMRKNEDE